MANSPTPLRDCIVSKAVVMVETIVSISSAQRWDGIQSSANSWASVIRDLPAIAEYTGASAEIGGELLHLQQKLFKHWHHHKEGAIDWPTLRRWCQPSRLVFEHVFQDGGKGCGSAKPPVATTGNPWPLALLVLLPPLASPPAHPKARGGAGLCR